MSEMLGRLSQASYRVVGANPKGLRKPKHPTMDGFEVVPMEDGTFFLFPRVRAGPYRKGMIPKRHCSNYAKKISNWRFGKEFVFGENKGESWNLRYFHKTIPLNKRNPFKQLETFFDNGIVVPGDLLGIYHPDSVRHLVERDRHGGRIPYSHSECVIGRDIYGYLRTAGQEVPDTRTISIGEMKERGLVPIEVIKPERLHSKRRLITIKR